LQIAKNLDSDTSMETKLQLLYKLQQADSRIDKIHLLRGELPFEVQDLEDEIEGLKTRIANLEKEIKTLEGVISQNKIDITSHKSLLAKYDEQRNNIKNSREYDSLSKQIENEELDIQLCEKRINDANKAIVEKKRL
jgi:Zn-ribbon protein, possibly nucleic acid-binding